MRTKTPKQIFEQWKRMSRITTTRKDVERLKRAAEITRRYWDNIYAANGIKDRMAGNTEVCNRIWETAATPISIYAKNVNN